MLYPLTVINLIKIASTLSSSGTSRFEFVTGLFDFLNILNLGSVGQRALKLFAVKVGGYKKKSAD